MEPWITLTALKTQNQEQYTHDAILMVFKNQKERNNSVVCTPNKDDTENKQSVDKILECQKILPFQKCKGAGIADNLTPGSYKVPEKIRQLR